MATSEQAKIAIIPAVLSAVVIDQKIQIPVQKWPHKTAGYTLLFIYSGRRI